METIILNVEVQKPIISIDGKGYFVNVQEIQSFFDSCKLFMPASVPDLVVQTQIISDTLIDQASPENLIGDLKNNIKFLKEIEFMLKGILTPIK
ncbi:hypothetical protein [Arcticibacter svalbardensis]|nr:hypothetical protein [Arcticibacter svalbardensis]